MYTTYIYYIFMVTRFCMETQGTFDDEKNYKSGTFPYSSQYEGFEPHVCTPFLLRDKYNLLPVWLPVVTRGYS